ncbi:MAG: hypothetical protein WDM88_04890 [Galbitalea sp.]
MTASTMALANSDGRPLRLGGEGRADHARSVLAGDDEHPEHRQHQLADPGAHRGVAHRDGLLARDGERGLGGNARAGGRAHQREQQPDPDREQHDDDAAPEGGAQREELDGLRLEHAEERQAYRAAGSDHG